MIIFNRNDLRINIVNSLSLIRKYEIPSAIFKPIFVVTYT